ncbi:glucose-1-phosphate adenylyltransferase [Aneurinibacillus tyrosinisolvens]|uniref:glucose-1-phosphate adenylyltransferase n=1 Tax=Aneurinibacillus tyrosinisolvens TaxID=1443435 RepID=UPI00063F2429|nr:glucose-1-phosphate adenylyltransferase [Aneurinibacillus tyrosinisolvens]
MKRKECIAMLLAGGEGKRLGPLTKNMAKPAIPFGGKYRIIDFALSNCSNSGIDTVGILTQYEPLVLHSYVGIGSAWELDRQSGGVTLLPPFVKQGESRWYKGTAHAIYQNIHFVEQYHPKYVLIISGDHIYKMNYTAMLQYHVEKKAEATIGVIEVPWREANRFGIMSVDKQCRITDFAEKPEYPDSNLASMGIYIFTWDTLKRHLMDDAGDEVSSHDFGKNIIPAMLQEGSKMIAYPFQGYWRDVGTIESLWEANMDLLADEPPLDLYDKDWRIYSSAGNLPPQYIAPEAAVNRSLINGGCSIYGEINHSLLFSGVSVGPGSVIHDSVIMPGVKIGRNVSIYKAIVGEGTVIEDGCTIGGSIGTNCEITVIGERGLVRHIPVSTERAAGSQ